MRQLPAGNLPQPQAARDSLGATATAAQCAAIGQVTEHRKWGSREGPHFLAVRVGGTLPGLGQEGRAALLLLTPALERDRSHWREGSQCSPCGIGQTSAPGGSGGARRGVATHSSRSGGSPASRARLPRAPCGPRGARGLLVSGAASPAAALMWSGRGPLNVTLLLGTVEVGGGARPGPSTFCFQSMAQRWTARWRLWATCNGLLSGHAMPCPLARGRGTRAYLHLLLGMQLLPEGLHVRCEPQEAGGALLEELLVVGLHCPLQPRLLPPPLQYEAQPRSPHLQEGEEVRPSSPFRTLQGLCPQPTLPSTKAQRSPGRSWAAGCRAPVSTFA